MGFVEMGLLVALKAEKKKKKAKGLLLFIKGVLVILYFLQLIKQVAASPQLLEEKKF